MYTPVLNEVRNDKGIYDDNFYPLKKRVSGPSFTCSTQHNQLSDDNMNKTKQVITGNRTMINTYVYFNPYHIDHMTENNLEWTLNKLSISVNFMLTFNIIAESLLI